MNFLQLSINSIITFLDELWKYQKENNYDGIFLQEMTQNPQITWNTEKVKCIQYRKAKMLDLGLTHSYQSQQKMFSGAIISTMTYGVYRMK